MSYGRHVTPSSYKSLSGTDYVHTPIYSSSSRCFTKSTLPAFKKPIVPSIQKYSSSKTISLASKKTSTASGRDSKPIGRSSLYPLKSNDDDVIRPSTRFSRSTATSTRHGEQQTVPAVSASGAARASSNHHRSSSLSTLSSSSSSKPESTFARLGLHSNTHISRTSSIGDIVSSANHNSSNRNSSTSSSSTSYYKSPMYDSTLSRRSSEKSLPKSRYEEGGSVGLVNIGNTCFMNCILQSLSNTKALRDFCMNSRYKNEINPNSPMRGNLLTGFVDVIRQLWNPDQDSVTPKNFKTQIQKFSPRFMGYDQQDSQEFLRFLLEGLHEEVNQVRRKSSKSIPEMKGLHPREKAQKTWEWYQAKDDSFIFDMFVGQLESALKCKECNHVSLTYDPFWDLSLPVNKTFMSGDITLDDCLQVFTKEETLDDDEKPFCDRCKARRRMTKKLSIHKFPPILVLHLKRFSEGSRFRQKLSHLVKYPLRTLDLTPYASRHHEDYVAPIYDLYAVSNHIGSCYGGHYTAYCCNPTTRQWNSFNDSSVRSMSESSVCTKEAYVLFYQLRRKNSRL